MIHFAYRLSNPVLCMVPALVLAVLTASACSPGRQNQDLLVTLVADGSLRTILLTERMSVAALLTQAEIETGPLDRIEPPLQTMLQDGMRITLVRVVEEPVCERAAIPFQIVRPPESDAVNAQRVRVGVPGEEERCYLLRLEDGIEQERRETGRVVIREPVDEIWQLDVPAASDQVTFAGTLVWISEGNAWYARQGSGHLRRITDEGRLDGKVLALSPNGDSLLFTERPGDGTRAPEGNRLLLVSDLDDPSNAVRLLPEDVDHAAWLPDGNVAFGYTGAGTNNGIAIVRLDPATGEILSYRELQVPAAQPAFGPGTGRFRWSSDGRRLAWQQDGVIGLLDVAGEFNLLPTGRAGESARPGPCSGRAPAWSPEGRFVVTGLADSPDLPSAVVMVDTGGEFSVPLAMNVGPCPAPTWAPVRESGLLAFLRARDPLFPLSRAGHELLTMDRDGSNSRVLFPDAGQPGLQPQQVVWSPDARHLAFSYQDRLWLLEVAGGTAMPLPFAGHVDSVVWAG